MHAPAAQSLESHKFRLSDIGDRDPPMNREAGPPMKRKKTTPGLDFRGLSSDEMRMTLLESRGLPKMSDKPALSDIIYGRRARRVKR
jgi:hypothetical protein